MVRFSFLLGLLFAGMQAAQAQNLVRLEYFLNSDPGFGNATAVSIPLDTMLNNFQFAADVTSLPPGLHRLALRTQDDAGRWSLTQSQFIFKMTAPVNSSGTPNLVRIEYFLDNDPGFGNATAVTFTADTLVQAWSVNINTSMLTPGMHELYFRSLDATGKWSLTQTQYLFKFSAPFNAGIAPAITRVEYFFDTDPGFGNANALSILSDSVLTGISFNANASALSAGLHVLYIRSQDATGQWSLTKQQFIYKFNSPVNNPMPKLSQLEYFIDTDPGFGLATQVSFSQDTLLSGFNINADVTAISSGLHSLFIRSKDSSGRWSLTQQQYFFKFPALENGGNAPNVVKMEYFLDTDPGFGQAIAVPITPAILLSGFTFNANVVSLSSGMHMLCLRSQDALGKWSLTQTQYLYKFPAPLNNGISPALVRVEYFLNTDPGFGNATPLTMTSDSVLANINLNVATASLPEGLHRLYIRSKDQNSVWSLTQTQYVYKFPLVNAASNLLALEYFVDVDPGFGNGQSIPFLTDTAANGVSFLVNVSNLPLGVHYLYVRSKNAQGAWSLTRVTRFTRDKIKLFIEGYYAGSNQMYPVLMNQGVGNATTVVDTVTVELRQSTAPYTLKASSQGLLQTNGEVLCNLAAASGSYYVVVKHRNAVQTWSATPISLGSTSLSYDFTTTATKAFGNNQKLMQPGVYAFYSGDVNQDGGIDAIDYTQIDPEITEGFTGYTASDFNGDGQVDLFDFLLLDSNIIQGIGMIDP